jgi:outer membrane protein assembly factor BamB
MNKRSNWSWSACLIEKSRLCGLCSVAVLSVLLFSAADWTRLRGPGATGISKDTGLPISWSATENIVWKTALPGKGGSSPITLGEKIFLTAYTGYGLDRSEPGRQEDLTHHVLCFNRADGKLLWDTTSKALLPEQPYDEGHIDLHGYASATPVTDGERLFVSFGRSGVRAYDLDGKSLWHAEVGSNLNGWGSAASPILFGDLVIVNASIESESLIAFDKKTGKQVWRVTGIVESWSTPLVVDLPDGGQELVLAMKGKVLGFNLATGKQLWHCASFPDYVVPMVVADDKGVVYITGGRSSSSLAARAGGRGDVTETHLLWTLSKGCKVPSPLVHDGLLYWVSNLDTAACIEADTGAIVYHQRLAERGAFYGSAVMAEGRIYAVSKMLGTVVLAAGREYKELARNKIEDDESLFNGTPVISNGQLLLRSDRFLYCIGK